MNPTEEPRAVVKINSPADIVGSVPHLVGFTPAESLTVVCLRGERQRVGLTMRFDLPAAKYEPRLSTEVVTRAAHAGAAALIMVCHTEADDDAQGLPRRALVDAVVDTALARGMAVADALLVRGGRWWEYHCLDGDNPREGHPLPSPAEGAGGRFAVAAAVAGRVTLASRAELEATVRPPVALQALAARQAFERASESVVDEWAELGFGGVAKRTIELLRAALDEHLTGTLELADEAIARIVLGLEDRIARDAAATLQVDDCEAYAGLLSLLARRTPEGYAAQLCTVLGWVAYRNGNGALASVGLERALLNDPTCELALVLAENIKGQVEPRHLRAVSRDLADELSF